MSLIAQRIRAYHIIASPPAILFQQTLTTGPVDEGDSFTWGIAVDLNSYSPSAGETASIEWRTMTATEFAANFPAQVQALVAVGDFTEGFTHLIDALAVTKGWSASPLSAPYSGRLITIPLDGAGPTLSGSITRVTVNRAGDNGSRRFAGVIASPSIGSIDTGHGTKSVVIEDVSAAPGAGDLTTIELSADLLAYISSTESPPAGTVVGAVYFKNDVGAAMTPGAAALVFLSGGDSEGRFEIFDTAVVGVNRYQIRATGVLANFEQVPKVNGGALRLNYPLAVAGTISGVTVQASLKIRANFPMVVTEGDLTDNFVDCATGEALRTALSSSVDDRTIRVTAGVAGVLSPDSFPAFTKIKGSRVTVLGNEHWLFRSGKATIVEGEAGGQTDVLFQRVAVGPGAPTTVADIDAALGYAANATGNTVERVLWDHCFMGLSNDEIWRATGLGRPAPRSMRVTRSVMTYALYDANHSKGKQHNHGPSVSDGASWITIDNCLIPDCDTRMIQINGAVGVYMVNNYVKFWKNGYAATNIIGGRGTLAENTGPVSCWIKGNLFDAGNASKAKAIWLYRIQKNATHIFIDSDNHFIDVSADIFTNDALTTSNGIVHQECSDASVLQSAPGFGVTGFTPAPTDTEAERRALIADLLTGPNRVGNGSPICEDAIAKALVGTADENVTPAQFDGWYGVAGVWDGVGGSRGHGVFTP